MKRRFKSVVVIVVCLTAIGALGLAAHGQAKAMPSTRVGSCDLHRKHAAAVTTRVIVYGQRSGRDNWEGDVTIYYACVRPSGKPVAVGRTAGSDGEYPPNETMSSPRVAGTFVANSAGRGFASASWCTKYFDTDCERFIKRWVEVVDAKTRRLLRVPVAEQASSVAVSPAGAVAWVLGSGSPAPVLQAMVLHYGRPGQLTGTTQALDSGAICQSLRFTGLTLQWTNSGQAKSQTLR